MGHFGIIEKERVFEYRAAEHPEAVLMFTTRRGGISGGRYATLNMGYSTDDSRENIYANRRLALEEFGLGIEHMVSSDQTHGTDIKEVFSGREDCGECDGLFTRNREVVLCMYFADCTPLYFYDPGSGAIGLVHAGWRGTRGRIGAKAVEFMKERYGARPEDILAVIGPSIGPCCFEVGDEVVEEFERGLGAEVLGGAIRARGNGKHDIDLKLINRRILDGSGIVPENLTTHEVCTSCEKDIFYSYRRDARDTGRMAGMAFIR